MIPNPYLNEEEAIAWLKVKLSQPAEICICGHAMYFHPTNGPCLIDRTNCRCNHAWPLFVTLDSRSFLEPHRDGVVGHALTQGVIWNSTHKQLRLSPRGLGKMPYCDRRGCLRPDLMPVLMGVHSRRLVGNNPSSRITLLWCSECIEREGHEYACYVGDVISREWSSNYLDLGSLGIQREANLRNKFGRR